MPCKKSRLDARASGNLARRRLRPNPGSDADARQFEYRADVSAGAGQPGRLLSVIAGAGAGAKKTWKCGRRFKQIFLEHRRRYGYRRVTAELRRRGMLVNHKRVARIMREDNLLAVQPQAFVVTTDSEHELEVYLNLASRMKLTGINQLWVADITYIRLQTRVRVSGGDPGCFLAQGGGLGAGPNAGYADYPWRHWNRRSRNGKPPPGLVHHSDRGVQYASGEYVRPAAKASDHSEHEPTSESIRQCQLRKLHEDAQARRDLRERLPESRTSDGERRGVHRPVLQSLPAALGAGLSTAGRIRETVSASKWGRTSRSNRQVFSTIVKARDKIRVWTLSSRWTHRTRPHGTWKTAQTAVFHSVHTGHFFWKRKERSRNAASVPIQIVSMEGFTPGSWEQCGNNSAQLPGKTAE